MADTRNYTIKSTDGTTVLVIQSGMLDGPTGAIQHTDLSLHGSGFPGWGEAVNENFLRVLENFACEERAPNLPKTSTQLGIDQGVNYPVIGQLWFNKTNQSLYTYTTSGWEKLLNVRDANFITSAVTGGLKLGTGANVFVNVTNGVMSFKGLVGSGAITITSNSTDVIISSNALAQAEDASNDSNAKSLIQSITNTSLFLKKLKSGTGIDLVDTGGVITINNTGGGSGAPEITTVPIDLVGYTFSPIDGHNKLIDVQVTLSGSSGSASSASQTAVVRVDQDITSASITVPSNAHYVVVESFFDTNAGGNNSIHLYTRKNSSSTYIQRQVLDPTNAGSGRCDVHEDTDTSLLILPFDTVTKRFDVKISSTRGDYPTCTGDDTATLHMYVVGFMVKETINVPVYNPNTMSYVRKFGDTMTGFLTLNADPTNDLHAATKQYVDSSTVGRNMIINGNFIHWQRGERLNFYKTVTNNTWVTYNDGVRDITKWQNSHSWDPGLIPNINDNQGSFTTLIKETGDEKITSYTADRWCYNHYDQGGNGGIVVRRMTDVSAPFEGIYGLEVVVTSPQPVTGASAWSVISQRIEGNNTARLRWGLSGASPVTLSFWVRSSAIGEYSICIRNQYYDIPSGQQRSYIVDYTIFSPNTWEKKTITIPGCTTGSWLKDHRIGVEILWLLAAGSGVRTTSTNQWITSGPIASDASTNFTTVNGASWQLAQVQFEMGSRATNFEHILVPLERQMCEYYYQTGNFTESAQPSTTALYNVYTNEFQIGFRTTMRVSPTVFPLFYSAACTGISPAPTSGLATCPTQNINIGPVSGGPYAAYIHRDKFIVEYAYYAMGDVALSGAWYVDAELY